MTSAELSPFQYQGGEDKGTRVDAGYGRSNRGKEIITIDSDDDNHDELEDVSAFPLGDEEPVPSPSDGNSGQVKRKGQGSPSDNDDLVCPSR